MFFAISENPDCKTIAEKINIVIGQEIELDGVKSKISGSIGIARYPFHTRDTNTLLRYADLAMYAAKRAGGGFVFYEAVLDVEPGKTG